MAGDGRQTGADQNKKKRRDALQSWNLLLIFAFINASAESKKGRISE